MTARVELLSRLQAVGFDLPQSHRILAALAGCRIPSAAQLQSAGRRQIARQLLDRGVSRADVTHAIAERFAISIRQAWRDTSGGL